ncbi:hypothetical protein D3C86_806690 [compost metagenome]
MTPPGKAGEIAIANQRPSLSPHLVSKATRDPYECQKTRTRHLLQTPTSDVPAYAKSRLTKPTALPHGRTRLYRSREGLHP